MYNKHTTALYAVVISSILVASMFAISFVQQALAQGNQTGGGSNQTSGAGSNQTSGSATSGGVAAGGSSTSGAGGGPSY
jgi:uncharacterized membrane protein